MKIKCNKCNNIIDRDKYIKGKKTEEYRNIYGTFCSNCGNFISTNKKSLMVDENELKLELLKEEIRDRLRKKINKLKEKK